jgi:hypothetical protein
VPYHFAAHIALGFAKVKKDSVLLRFKRGQPTGDVFGVVLTEEVGDVMAEVCAGDCDSGSDTPRQVQRHFDAGVTGFGIELAEDRICAHGIRNVPTHAWIVKR